MTEDEFRAACKRCGDLVRRRDELVKKLDVVNGELAELTETLMFHAAG